MEGIRPHSPFARLAAEALADERFKLVDVGCWGGIDPGWREFGDRLDAIGFDCVEAEVQRLTAAERNPAVRYVQGWVGLPADHPARLRLGARAYQHNWPGGRLSYQRSIHIREAKARGEAPLSLADYYRTVVHGGAPEPAGGFDTDYARTEPYDGSGGGDEVIFLPAYLQSAGFGDADFIKIDVDGPDFEILRALPQLASPGLLGVAAEVNFYGSHDANDHTFHNVDRLMRANGFDLFRLSIRQYSSAALPWPYLDTYPALTADGRPVQGDAVYLRDLASPVRRETAAAVSDEKLMKLAGLFALFSLPDEAAEVLLVHGDRLKGRLDIDAGLALLTAQIQENDGTDLSHAAYMAAFEAEAPQFMDQYGRRATWMAGLMETSRSAAAEQRALRAALEAAQSALADREAQLAVLKASPWRRLLDRLAGR